MEFCKEGETDGYKEGIPLFSVDGETLSTMLGKRLDETLGEDVGSNDDSDVGKADGALEGGMLIFSDGNKLE